ncbi:MAG: hypothetical protein IPG44_12735 [Anaerolineales bacterium]|jgi:hypothetical protein|nr:hypothetical protein [Anaerolineales bacterium]
MDKKEIQSIIQEAVEKEIPASEIALWQTVKASLVEKQHQQGVKMNTNKSRGVSRLAYATLAVAVLLTLAFFTPQGRAFAQQVFHFFTRADKDRYPLQEWQKTPPAQTSSESPFKYSVQEAESLAGYDVLSPVEVPFGMFFVGASYDEKYHIVAQAFGQSAEYIELSLWQQPLEHYQLCGDISQLCDNMLGGNLAGNSADIQTVQIGDLTGEYVEGVWNLTDNGPVWEPTPFLKTLRWKNDTMIFELIGGIDQTRDDLVKLAESIR